MVWVDAFDSQSLLHNWTMFHHSGGVRGQDASILTNPCSLMLMDNFTASAALTNRYRPVAGLVTNNN